MTGTEQPRTAAGQDTLADPYFAPPLTPFYDRLRERILAIEAEAASPSREALAAALKEVIRALSSGLADRPHIAGWEQACMLDAKGIAERGLEELVGTASARGILAAQAQLPEWADPGVREANPDGSASWRSSRLSRPDSREPR